MKLYRRISLLLSAGIMAIGLISFKFSPALATADSSKSSSETDIVTQAVTPSPAPTAVPTPTPIPNTLEKLDGNTGIDRLIEAFLEAKLSCDIEQFADIVTDTSAIDEAQLQQRYETIIDIYDVVCYAKKGLGPIDYVVYYTYYSHITTIELPAISIDRVYVSVDADGTYRIYYGDIDSDIEEQLNMMNYDADVQQLITDTYAVMEEEIAQDEQLYSFWMRALPGVEFNRDNAAIPSTPEPAGEGDEETGDPAVSDAPAEPEPQG